MSSERHTIVLASASPRRSELLALTGVAFDVIPADICETPLPGEAPTPHVMRLSYEKAGAVSASCSSGRFFIGADTIVVLDGAILGKPGDEADAVRMLTALSGRSHQVITGFTVYDKERDCHISSSVSTEVTFKPLNTQEIAAYIATGCPMDKAGSYAIQGGAIHFVRSINGSYSNVVGLPMTELYETLRSMEAIS